MGLCGRDLGGRNKELCWGELWDWCGGEEAGVRRWQLVGEVTVPRGEGKMLPAPLPQAPLLRP